MEHKFNYSVHVETRSGDDVSIVRLFDCELIEEACSFALGCHRSINVRGVSVVVVSLFDSSEVVRFVSR